MWFYKLVSCINLYLFPGFWIIVYCFVLASQGQSWSGSAACLHGVYHDVCQDSVIFPDLYSSVRWTRLRELQQFEETDCSVHYSKWCLDSCSLPLHDSYRKNNARLHGEWQNNSKEEVTLKWLCIFLSVCVIMLVQGNLFLFQRCNIFLKNGITNTISLC